MIDCDIDKVIPESSWVPKRVYSRKGNTIECFSIIGDSGGTIKSEIKLSEKPIFVIALSSDVEAKTLMNDLFYGEYTGS